MVFLALSYATVYLIYMRFRNSYDSENDTFRVEFLLVPVIGLSFLENYAFTPMEVKTHSNRIFRGKKKQTKKTLAQIWKQLSWCNNKQQQSITVSFSFNCSRTGVPPIQILWTFSIFLEAVAIMPQLFMITKTGEAESITTHYLFFLGLYRALYIANWVWRYHTEGFFDQIAVVSGVVQTIFYCDFFYLYTTRGELA